MKFVINLSFNLGSVISVSGNNYLLCRSVPIEVRPFDNCASDAREPLARLLKTYVRQVSKPVWILACFPTLLF